MWLKGHQPDIFARAHLALQPRDLVGHALTGEFATDGTHAAATLAFDLRRRAWADDLVDAMGLPLDLFPAVRPSSEPMGGLMRSSPDASGCQPGPRSSWAERTRSMRPRRGGRGGKGR